MAKKDNNFDALENFKIPSLQIEFDIDKHISEKINSVKEIKPIFSFKYISYKGKEFCFNSKCIATKDYHDIFEWLQKLSIKTYNELDNDKKTYHFHTIKFEGDKEKYETLFKKAIGGDAQNSECPTVYQMKVHSKMRIIGFIFNQIFHIVWIDTQHKLYDQQNKNKVRR